MSTLNNWIKPQNEDNLSDTKNQTNLEGQISNSMAIRDDCVLVKVPNKRDQADLDRMNSAPLFGASPEDMATMANESQEMRQYWEASLPDCGQARCPVDDVRCWTCLAPFHVRVV